jgi:hypothetical protein
MVSAEDSGRPRTLSDRQFTIASIYKCLAPCHECSRNYVSELLKKRFICYCSCHNKITVDDYDFGFTTTLQRFRGIGGV